MKKIIGVFLIVLVVVASIYIKFHNPDMTDTRLLMAYWKEEIVMLVTGFIGLYLASREN